MNLSDLTPGDQIDATYDGGHYDNADVLIVTDDKIVVEFSDFTDEQKWETRLFIVPKDKIDTVSGTDELTFAIEDGVLADVVPSADDRQSFSRIVEPQFLRQTDR